MSCDVTVLFMPRTLHEYEDFVELISLKSQPQFRREDTWRLIVLTLLVKSLAALTKVSKDTVPGYAVRHTSCWKNIQPWKWITSLSSHAHRVFNHTDRHTNLNIPLKRYTRTHTPCRSRVLTVILPPFNIVPSDIIARIPEEPQWRHMGDTQRLSFRVEGRP